MIIVLAGEDSKFCAQLQGLLLSQSHAVSLLPLAGLLEALHPEPPHLLVLAGTASRGSAAALLSSLRADSRLRLLPVPDIRAR